MPYIQGPDSDRVDFEHPANRGILAYLGNPARLRGSLSVAKDQRSVAPASVKDAYYRLGTHPDLVELLWDQLGAALPKDCRWIVYGTPVLVRPDSGVIFAFCGGTHTYAFRLPPAERAAAIAAGAKTVHRYPAYDFLGQEESVLDLKDIGEEWVFGGWHRGEEEWCRAAYTFAALDPN